MVLRGLISEAEETLEQLHAEIVSAALTSASDAGLTKLKGEAAKAEKRLTALRAKASQGDGLPPVNAGAKTIK